MKPANSRALATPRSSLGTSIGVSVLDVVSANVSATPKQEQHGEHDDDLDAHR